MTEKELQDILSMVEDIIAKENGDVCHQVADLIRNLKTNLEIKYQRELAMTIEQINMVLANHNIDCKNRDCISGDEIVKYVNENVPDAEPLNE